MEEKFFQESDFKALEISRTLTGYLFADAGTQSTQSLEP